MIYILISYIIPQIKIGRKLEELLAKFDSIMKYNNTGELLEFIKSKVEFESLMIKDSGKKKTFIKIGFRRRN